jgi:glycosyltransferase involved in cell wall biosynthesis
MSERPLVSIVTPSLDQARFLEATVRSVADQDYPAIEHIVVDGGSTDETLDLLRAHPELTWSSEPDEGQADAVNKGFRRASGEILGWLNSDDVYLPRAISRAVDALLAHPDCGMVYCNFLEIDQTGAEIARAEAPGFDLDRLVNSRNYILQPTVFIRRAVLDDVGYLDPSYRYTMDWDLWIRIGKRHPVLYVDDYWAATRWHGGTKSAGLGARRSGDFWPESRRVSRSHGGRLVSDLFLDHWAAVVFGRRTLVAVRLLRQGRLRTIASKVVNNLSRASA